MSRKIVLIDAHVHVYPHVNVSELLSAADRNFRAAAARIGATEWRGVLMLSEVCGVEWFDSAADEAGGRIFGRWHVQRSPEDPISLTASAGEEVLTIVAGRQIVTSERVEVHALGTRAKFTDGLETRTTLAAVHQSGALAVLPWGVGKWLGKRGRLVEEILSSSGQLGVYAADNSGRPGFWQDRRFALTRQMGRPLLAGSDPLPLVGEESRVGAFGCWLDRRLPVDAPMVDLIAGISSLGPDAIQPYGSTETVSRFLRNQLSLRIGWRRLGSDAT